jgi:hypothetical protein
MTDNNETTARVLGAIHDFAAMKPEEGETWESWHAASLELLADKVGDLLGATAVDALEASPVLDEEDAFQSWWKTRKGQETGPYHGWMARAALVEATSESVPAVEAHIKAIEDAIRTGTGVTVTRIDPDDFRAKDGPAVEARARDERVLPQSVLDALRFYAHRHHYNIDSDHQQFDTVSGEPQNWLFSERDDDCTMIEDGSIAKAALCGAAQGFEEPTTPVDGEIFCTALARASEATHTDDVAVDSFARAMKDKMAQARAKGRSGWEGMDPADLSRMLREHVEKGDPRDVANFCMMMWHHSASIDRASEAADAEAKLDAALTQVIDERDHFEAEATKLAERVGEYLGVDVGEWSSANDPIHRAMDALDEARPYARASEAAAGEPVADAWIWCDTIYPEHCHLTDEDAIEEGWDPLYRGQYQSIPIDLLAKLLPGTYYMDPPDGGSVSVMDQLRRMADDAKEWREHIAAPQPASEQQAQPISDAMMDLVDRLGSEAKNVDPRAWEHLRVYMPTSEQQSARGLTDPVRTKALEVLQELSLWKSGMSTWRDEPKGPYLEDIVQDARRVLLAAKGDGQ